jgi:hypothetical protein
VLRLVRPLVDRFLGRRHARGQLGATPAPDPSIPYAGLVAAFAGSPIAGTLQRTLNELWQSPILSRRCKLLMFAVVSRGLPCAVCELQLSRALTDEGLSPETQQRVLEQLDAPQLDDTERLLLPFVRETLWYEPATLQRRTRALSERLSRPQLMEAIGVAAMANALCRMTAVVLEADA